jgi:hypothetical protein
MKVIKAHQIKQKIEHAINQSTSMITEKQLKYDFIRLTM